MNRNQTINDLMENMGFVMRFASRLHGKPAKSSPTRAQLGVLFMIGHFGMQNIKDLARKFEMSSSAVTQLVDGLVKDRLLTRKEDLKDRRKIRLELTEQGRKQLLAGKKARVNFLIKLFKPLSDEDISHLNRIQNKIIKSLQNNAR